MSDEQDKLKLSLEPPKLFGRKKKPDAVGTSKSTPAAPAGPDRPASEPPAPADETAVDEPPVETPVETPVDEPTDAPVEDPVEVPVDETVEAPVDETVTEDLKATEPEPAPEPEPEPEPEPVATKPAPKPAPTPKATEPTEPAGPVKKAARPRAKLAPPIEPEPLSQIEREDAEIVARAATEPLLATYPAAAVTGAVVGLVMVVLTWLSLRGCEAIRDTSSCGGGPGFALLVATFVLCILLGSTMLKLFTIPDPGSSSFLAVGLVAVVSLLFLIDVLDHWSMLIVVPVIGVGSYLASVWVTETFVEPGDA